MKEITEEEYLKASNEQCKACNGCKHRWKEVGFVSEQKGEKEGFVYGCGLGQMAQLYKEVHYLPEDCSARNFFVGQEIIKVKEERKRDNCAICSAYKEFNPICKRKDIRILFCPCKECGMFTLNEEGCMNFSKACQEGIKYERIS